MDLRLRDRRPDPRQDRVLLGREGADVRDARGGAKVEPARAPVPRRRAGREEPVAEDRLGERGLREGDDDLDEPACATRPCRSPSGRRGERDEGGESDEDEGDPAQAANGTGRWLRNE